VRSSTASSGKGGEAFGASRAEHAASDVKPDDLATATAVAGQDGRAERRVLVLGYGNTLRRDDGVGVRVAELMADDPRFAGVEVRTAYQLTPEVALDIAAASLVVFVDADVRALPGFIEVHELGTTDALAAGLAERHRGRVDAGASSHHVGADEVLALARELVGAEPRAFALGIGVADLELGEGLSPPVEAALPRVLDVVARLVADQRPA
jgi:hydrogenase maturation protease